MGQHKTQKTISVCKTTSLSNGKNKKSPEKTDQGFYIELNKSSIRNHQPTEMIGQLCQQITNQRDHNQHRRMSK